MKRSRARSPAAIDLARAERAAANEFASTVWQWVRNRQICHQKFRREHPISPYTADFCCVELKLILEIDGAEHLTEAGQERDRIRDDFLSKLGYRIVRIPGYEVLQEGRRILELIRQNVELRMLEFSVENR